MTATPAIAGSASVVVDGATKHQVIEGGGVAVGPGDFPIPFEDVAAQLVSLGFRTDRQFTGLLEQNNDDSDPFHFNWDVGPNALNTQLAAADPVFRRAQTLQRAGVKIWIGPQGVPAWLEDGTGHFDSSRAGTYDELAESWAAYLIYAKNNYGLDYMNISVSDEPDCLPGTQWNAAQVRDAIKVVGARLAREGLTTRIRAPETAILAIAQSWFGTIFSDATAASFLDRAAYHPYDTGADFPRMAQAMRAFATDPLVSASGLPIWMTEYVLQRTGPYIKRSEAYIETWPYAIDTARIVHTCYVDGNCSSVTLSPGIAGDYEEDNGMFGPGLGPGGLRLKPFGNAISQYHRFIEPGSKRIDATVSGASSLFVSAFLHPTSGALTVVALNRAAAAASVSVSLRSLGAPTSFRAVRSSANEAMAELGRVAVTAGAFAAALPAESITTFVGSTAADTSAPSVPANVAAAALSDTMVRVSWSACTDAVAVAGYKVFRNGVEVGNVAGTSFLDHDLSGTTAYSYCLQAFDLSGNASGQSATATATTLPDTTPPAVPTHVVATPVPAAVVVTWDPSTDKLADFDLKGYRVYRATAPGGPYSLVATVPSSASGYTDGALANGQTSYYVVSSFDDEAAPNESARSAAANALPNPRVTGGLRADYYDGKIVSTWDWHSVFKSTRVDPTVDFNWEVTTPPAGRYITGQYGTTPHWSLFGARWQGEVLADQTGTYTFTVVYMDGARLWVDGKLIVDDWKGWFTHTNTAAIQLAAGWHAVRLDYYRYHPEAGEDGVIRLSWTPPSSGAQVIPASHLATVSTTPPADGGDPSDGGAPDATVFEDGGPALDGGTSPDAGTRPPLGEDEAGGPSQLVGGCGCNATQPPAGLCFAAAVGLGLRRRRTCGARSFAAAPGANGA